MGDSGRNHTAKYREKRTRHRNKKQSARHTQIRKNAEYGILKGVGNSRMPIPNFKVDR